MAVERRDAGRWMRDREPNGTHTGLSVPEKAKQAGEVRTRWVWTEPSVWTERMLTALETGVTVDPRRGEPPTGEPYAGEPHVRFGGGRSRVLNRLFLPYQALSLWERA